MSQAVASKGQERNVAARQQEQRQAQNEQPLMPPVDVIEDSTGITLYADLPGVTRENLDLHVEGDSLSIEGSVKLEVPEALQPTYAEVNSSRYRRVFTLSKELDPEKITAELAQGVLKLRIPKAEHAQPRRIEIRS
jgi:HSP20 family molecular chaperone IbpA